MQVVFIHGPVASGKYTIGKRLGELTGLPLFHNHLVVDTVLALFDFGTPGFIRLRADLWRTCFAEAATSGRSFIFTFNPEATVDPALIGELTGLVESRGGRVHFVELHCPREVTLERLDSDSRRAFGKLTDKSLYATIAESGGFEFAPLPEPVISIATDLLSPDEAAEHIAAALDGLDDAQR